MVYTWAMNPITDPLQKAIVADGRTLRALAEAAGLSAGILSRFTRRERTLTLPAADALADVLGLELRPRKTKRRR